MDPTTRQNIIDILTEMLKRPPHENEIMNAQTDSFTMAKVKDIQIAGINNALSVQGAILKL